MTTTKATLTLTITEAAQRKALIDGQPAQHEQTYAIPQEGIERLLALPWTRVASDGSVSCNVPTAYHYTEHEIDNPVALGQWDAKWGGYGRIELPINARPIDPDQALVCAEAVYAAVIHEMATKRAKRRDERNERQRQRDADLVARIALVQGLLDGAPDTWFAGPGLRAMPSLDGVPEVLAKYVRESYANVERLYTERCAAEADRVEVEPRAWCAEHGAQLSGPLARAAREGRKVRAELTRLVFERLRVTIAEIAEVIDADVETSYNSSPREDVPTAEAYGVLDALQANADKIAKAAIIPGVVVEIGPIARHDIIERGPAKWRTGVEVRLAHPWLTDDFGLVVLAEPADDDDDDE